MTVIRLTCSWCGDIDLPPADVTIILNDRSSITGQYQFDHCDQTHLGRANGRVVGVLQAAGCVTDYLDNSIDLNELHELLAVDTVSDIGWVSS